MICTAFAQVHQGRSYPVVAAGCMDGSVLLAYCGLDLDSKDGKDRILKPEVHNVGNGVNENGILHSKYVKTICWSPSSPILASASADGTVQLTRVGGEDEFLNVDGKISGKVTMEVVQSMHFDGPVEAMCFLNDGDTLCCYVRGTCYLSYFDLKDGCKQTKCSLNGGCEYCNSIPQVMLFVSWLTVIFPFSVAAAGTGCFDEHVSFAILSLRPSPNGKYIAAATDVSRNIIMEAGTERIVRNLYGVFTLCVLVVVFSQMLLLTNCLVMCRP